MRLRFFEAVAALVFLLLPGAAMAQLHPGGASTDLRIPDFTTVICPGAGEALFAALDAMSETELEAHLTTTLAAIEAAPADLSRVVEASATLMELRSRISDVEREAVETVLSCNGDPYLQPVAMPTGRAADLLRQSDALFIAYAQRNLEAGSPAMVMCAAVTPVGTAMVMGDVRQIPQILRDITAVVPAEWVRQGMEIVGEAMVDEAWPEITEAVFATAMDLGIDSAVIRNLRFYGLYCQARLDEALQLVEQTATLAPTDPIIQGNLEIVRTLHAAWAPLVARCGADDMQGCFELAAFYADDQAGRPQYSSAQELYQRACAGGVPAACEHVQ